MKRPLLVAGLFVALVLAGAGCGPKPAPQAAAPGQPTPTTVNRGNVTADKAADQIIQDADSETAQVEKESADAKDASATDAEEKAFTDSTYEAQ